MTHTPLPWRIEPTDDNDYLEGASKGFALMGADVPAGKYYPCVADNTQYYPQALSRENAELIVATFAKVAEIEKELSEAKDRIDEFERRAEDDRYLSDTMCE